jgi:site-specific DNA-methyltransferase (adenine-specific)
VAWISKIEIRSPQKGDIVQPHRIAITDVKVGIRIRKEYGDLESLASSINRHGQLQPIVITDENILIAGERRLEALKLLGAKEVDCVFRAELDETQRLELELEENIRRKDFTWPEEVSALFDLYELKQAKYGARSPNGQVVDGTTQGFGVKDAAAELDRAVGSISMDLALAKAIREFPKLAEEKTKSAAFRRYKHIRELQLRQELAKRGAASADNEIDKLVAGTPMSPAEIAERLASDSVGEERPAAIDTLADRQASPTMVKKAGFKGYGLIYNGNSQYILRNMPSASVDCVITDPPYGLNLHGSEDEKTSGKRLVEFHGGLYDDDPHKVLEMLDDVTRELARILKPDGHLYLFFHHNWYSEIYDMLGKHFGHKSVEATPIIWIKNTSGMGNPYDRWIYGYEPAMFVNRGRKLVKSQDFNYIKADTVPPTQKIHPVEKPLSLLRHIVGASCTEKEVVLDPFCGSGSTLVAAVQMGVRFMGIELDEKYYRRTAERVAEEIAALGGPEAPKAEEATEQA